MQKNTLRRLAMALCLAGSLAIAGCNSHADKIRDIEDDPSRFARHDVTVAGEVTKVYELPLGITDVAAYRITDGTGQIWVISRAGAPREGDRVGIRGEVDTAGTISGTALGVVIREKRRELR